MFSDDFSKFLGSDSTFSYCLSTQGGGALAMDTFSTAYATGMFFSHNAVYGGPGEGGFGFTFSLLTWGLSCSPPFSSVQEERSPWTDLPACILKARYLQTICPP